MRRLEWASLLASLCWPAAYALLRWPPWAGLAAGTAALLCALAAAGVFRAMPEGAREEYLAHAGRAGGPWKGLVAVALWNGYWLYILLR